MISQRIDRPQGYSEARDALDQRLTSMVLYAGYIPVAVPNCLEKNTFSNQNYNFSLNNWMGKINPDAIILSGGNDVGSEPIRDVTEEKLLSYSEENHLPVLGICRGMQMIGILGGATLKKVKNHVNTRHNIKGEITREVNSYHNYVLNSCPEGFSVLARSEDGYIEAIKHDVLSWEGWMWHPERESYFCGSDIERMQKLFG